MDTLYYYTKFSCAIIFFICSVMTPYYSEETVYSKGDLEMENEDGVSIIYYLQKIYPGFILLSTT